MNLVLCNLVPLKEKTEGDKILSRLIAELSGYDFFFFGVWICCRVEGGAGCSPTTPFECVNEKE